MAVISGVCDLPSHKKKYSTEEETERNVTCCCYVIIAIAILPTVVAGLIMTLFFGEVTASVVTA